MVAIFSSFASGPPPGNATTGSNQWIELGVIPLNQRIWFGGGTYTSPDKSITFELRTNLLTKSAATDADTLLLATTSVSTKSGTITADYYKNGRLHITSVYGTGVEKFWLRLKSKSGTAGGYLYMISYTTE